MTSSSPIFQNWSFFLAEQHLKRKNLKKKWSKNNSPISRKCSRTLSGHYHEHIGTYLKSEIDGRLFRQEYNAWKSMVMPETGRYPVIYLAFPCIFRHSFSSTKACRERSHRFIFENWVNSATELALAWEFLHIICNILFSWSTAISWPICTGDIHLFWHYMCLHWLEGFRKILNIGYHMVPAL